MPLHLESLKAEISRLPLQDRAILAKHIIYSFDQEEELEVEKIGLRKSQWYTKGEIQSKSTEMVFQIEHPYITSHKDYCGGSPVIVGTKFPVHSVVNYVLKQGLTPEELVKEFKHLNLSQVYDALSYYYDYPAEIERALLENTESQLKDEWNK